MSSCKLDLGTIVQFARASTVAGADSGEYRVEQLVMLACGAKLYKIKSAAEPFDRIVSERDLAERS
jgi:hypothetical protein